MKNIIILGSGRSGTSLLGGLFSKGGFYMGVNLIPPRDTNPRGFFESEKINSINEEILKLNLPRRRKILYWEIFKNRPANGQRWLSTMPLNKKLKVNNEILNMIEGEASKMPFCFKDPRFSYTLPVWAPYLENTVCLVVFRHPISTVRSVLKECSVMPYLESLKMSEKGALKVWVSMYLNILEMSKKMDNFHFFHYEQLLSGEAYNELNYLSGAKVYEEFTDLALQRNKPSGKISIEAENVYNTLCELSRFKH